VTVLCFKPADFKAAKTNVFIGKLNDKKLHVAAHVRTGASWKFSEAPQETLSKEQPRGAEGVKRPLSIQNIYVCFLSFSPTL